MAEDLDYLNNLIDQGTDTNGEVDVEMALLALCMRRNSAILKVVENKIEEKDFSDARNRVILRMSGMPSKPLVSPALLSAEISETA